MGSLHCLVSLIILRPRAQWKSLKDARPGYYPVSWASQQILLSEAQNLPVALGTLCPNFQPKFGRFFMGTFKKERSRHVKTQT